MNYLKTLTIAAILLGCAWSVQGQSARNSLNGNWLLTDAYVLDANHQRDAHESASVLEDLTVKHQFAYNFNNEKLSISVDGQPKFLYYITEDADQRIAIDEPLKDAFVLMNELQVVEVDENTLVLKSAHPDANFDAIYEVFTRQ